jgi:hypothetical protein
MGKKAKSRKGTSRAGRPAPRQAKDVRAAVKLLTDTLADLDPRKRAEGQLVELLFLSRALDCLESPVRTAENWMRPADFPEFLSEIEKRIRAVWDLINTSFRNPLAPSGDEDRERAWIVSCDLDMVQKNLDLVAKVRADRTRTPADFFAEAEELRRLRNGELKIDPPPASKRKRP